MPKTEYEIVVDKMIIDKLLNSYSGYAKMSGLTTLGDFLERKLSAIENNHLEKFTIVGIVDLQSPSIYVQESLFINLLAGTNEQNNDYGMVMYQMSEGNDSNQIMDYKILEGKIELKKGRMPENDYEVIVSNSHRFEMPLGKEIDEKINETKLKVVGYYESKYNYDYKLVNNNTVKYKLITEKEGFSAYAVNKEQALQRFQELKLNVKDSYQNSKDEYLRAKSEQILGNLIFSGIILAISLIEIYLMMRSSFLSRIKEIGILRAIGVKKSDIYKMFIGEAIAITTLASLPGAVLISYILKIITTIPQMENIFIINYVTVLGTILFIYIFNLMIGLLPVFNIVRKRPSQILSRHDI